MLGAVVWMAATRSCCARQFCVARVFHPLTAFEHSACGWRALALCAAHFKASSVPLPAMAST
eukprot:9491776-Pyramimonas_sp.AAC.1